MRLLVIEDDRALRAALRGGLVARGFAVDVASTIAEANGLLGVNGYDLIVLDLGLPDGDGLSILRRLRDVADPLPVLILSARGTVADRVGGLEAGGDDYLQKPFAFPELVARIHALMRRGVAVTPTVLRVGDLELDPARLEVRREGARIPLTVKEFAILECFMRHAGELVTRTMLLDHCWDSSYDGVSNLVDVHVGRVRRKLDAAGSRTALHTVRGAGFIFDERAP